MTLKSFLSPLFLLIVLFANSHAQTLPPSESSKEEEKEKQELEKKALALLNEILDDAGLLKLPENRSYVFAVSADLLWKYDEKRARIFFQSAMNDLVQAVREKKSVDYQNGDSLWVVFNQRQQLLSSSARHDPQFALDMLQSSRQTFTENAPLYAGMMDQELNLEQSIVTEVVAKDPKRALQMAQESLTKGVSYQILNLLYTLQSKDIDAANTFAVDIIKKLGSMDFNKNREASMVAQNLLRKLINTERTGANSKSSQPAKKIKPLVVDDQTTRDLIDTVINAVLNSSTERYDLMQLQSLLPELEKRVPERAAQLRKKVAEQNEKLDPNLKLMLQYSSLRRDGKPEAILEAAAKAPPDMRGMLYQAAVEKFVQNGDLEAARKVVVEHFSGPEGDQMLAGLDEKLIAQALKQEKLDEARKLIERITPTEARLAQIANMAIGMFAKGDTKMATTLLNETRQLVNRSPENLQELNAMLKVAKAYAVIEPAGSFGVFGPVIDQANTLLSAAAVLDKFGADRSYFRDGEYRMNSIMNSGWDLSSKFSKELALLARYDFARTQGLADRFLRDEARTMARLLIAQAVLDVRPNEDEK